METNAENASQPPKKTRTRSKSVSGENTALSSEEEMAPNLNGNKDGGGNETDSASESKQEKQEPQHHENPKTRKRKAMEMKLDENPPEETPVTPDDDAKEKEVIKEAHKETSDETASITDVHPEDESSTNDSTSDLKDIVVPEKNLLGKGKRARIPNKRYSDIPAKYDSPKSKSTENGQLPDSETTEILKEEAESDSGSASYSSKRSASSPGGQSNKKLKPNVDLNNPNYLKPFQFGWKRELVYRANNDNTLKRNGDIYYYTPSGKKVRSMREVAENLKNKELSIDDFTFFKEPLGVEDPEKEIIRDAKLKTTTIVPKKMTPKMAKTPKVTSPKTSPTAPATTASETPKVAKSPRVTPGFKVKIPKGSSSKKEKKPKEDTTTEMEIGTYPPNWSGKKGKGNKKTVDTPKSRPLRSRKAPEKEEKEDSGKFMETYLQNLAFGYKTLLYVFQYLKVQDLLRAGCVCQMWKDVSRHPLLWSTVRMKNSQIHSFEGLANALEQHGTVHLDLRKMLLPTNGGDDIWPSFTQAIKKVESLRKIELCRCLASVVEDLARNNHNLEVINAVTIKCESMTFEPFKNLKNLTDLRLKSTAGLTLTSDLSALKELTKLRHLSITSIKDLNKLNIEVIGELVNLEVLDIGECSDFPIHFGPEILSRLVKLEKLRLEKGQGECYTFEMLDAVKDLQNLYQLELVNFDIKPGFDRALGACLNIKKLLIIPTYISQSATTNHMVLGGVLKLQKTLSQFVWGVTLELLRVTELFVDQCEQPDKKDVSKDKNPNNGDSIPVLKPVPLHGVPIPEAAVASDTPQVEILPLPTLQKLLLQNLPTTRVKILKIPFHATWRQSITDSVN